MHTRGRRFTYVSLNDKDGTTHAHAGQTLVEMVDTPDSRNHPCTRGADNFGKQALVDEMEPPMHTRGRRQCTALVMWDSGTTHAHAGQTLAD